MSHNIKEGAIFISDAHENDIRDDFYNFLLKIKSSQIRPTQLFLMGDMFDLLVGEVEYLKTKYRRHIDLIDEIAQKIEVFYFEGNHDFALKNIFKNVEIIDISMQPTIFSVLNKKILLSHGDKYGGILHKFFTSFIRNKNILRLLNTMDVFCNSCISKSIEKHLSEKNICLKIKNFKQMINIKIKKNMDSNVDVIAEGHYHQNKIFLYEKYKYINFPSFACNQSYFIVQLSPELKFIETRVITDPLLRGYDV